MLGNEARLYGVFMENRWLKPIVILIISCLILGFTMLLPVSAAITGQQPTVDIPTVTSSPRGAYVVVNAATADADSINVRAGPSPLTEKVGVLLVGQEANAVGRYGDWIQIEYPGVPGGKAWVFGNLVTLLGGDVPIVEPPATSTPQTTKTIDPTLAAQFIITAQPSRLPTFTEPAPLSIPTFAPETGATAPGNVPMGFVIIGLGALGIFLGLISLIQGK